LILRGLKSKYEETHGVVVRDDAIVAASELSSRYISGRQLPDKAVDLLDTSAARVKILLTAKPDILDDKERTIQALEREKKALERDQLHGVPIDEGRLPVLDEEIKKLIQEVEKIRERWQREQEFAQRLISLRKEFYDLQSGGGTEGKREELKGQIDQMAKDLEALQSGSPLVRTEVNPDVVAKVVSDWTGIPLGKVLRDEAQNILNLEANLKQRIKGQEEALATISQVIKAAKTGLKDPHQPLGVFLLAGPSGVGKTETGLVVADLLFGGERFLVTINMSEFQEGHTVSRLIGSPPGYVGYGEGGVLTEAVRQRPYSVVLIDETEKAHIDVMNLFYQVFDKGMLADGEGRIIDFRNTIVFLTSNLATDVITQLCADGARPPVETVAAAIRPILSHHFKPALLARMTIVPFYTLNPNFIKEIVALKFDKLAGRMAESHKMKLTYSQEVVNQIASRCTEVESGARNIDHIMNGTILPQMSREILNRLSEGNMPSEAHLGLAGDGSFKIDFGG
jgi:type VI secretion system protein VasG